MQKLLKMRRRPTKKSFSTQSPLIKKQHSHPYHKVYLYNKDDYQMIKHSFQTPRRIIFLTSFSSNTPSNFIY